VGSRAGLDVFVKLRYFLYNTERRNSLEARSILVGFVAYKYVQSYGIPHVRRMQKGRCRVRMPLSLLSEFRCKFISFTPHLFAQ
jgi:hypothetical protein